MFTPRKQDATGAKKGSQRNGKPVLDVNHGVKMTNRKDAAEDIESLVSRYSENKREELRDLIMVQCAPMVERIARRFSGLESVDDLVQVGFIGLLNALSKFDPNAGVKFNTYATYLVGGEIKHYLRDRAQTIRQPAWLQELRHKVNRTASQLQCELARTPTHREIAEALGLSENAVSEVFQTQEMLRLTSLDATTPGEDDDSDLERLDAGDFCPDQLSVEDRLLLESAMKQLRDLERQVLTMFHFDSMNQTEIAANLGISCNYVSHILRQSLTKLRKILVSEEESDRVLRRQGETFDAEVIDAMTGSYSEAFFRTRLEEEVHRAQAQGTAVGLVTIEFTGLDALRRFYGEQSVNEFMIDAAGFFRDSVRRLDLVCRVGNTGFGLILPSVDDNITVVRDRLIKLVSRWMQVRYATSSPVSVIVKHAAAPHDAKTGRELIGMLKEATIAFKHAA
jgi:RNA polymerase sigma-B factor